ncbi:hypothetical protein RN001_008495 [Aquatica leii]|uniref:NADH dehydrogenase [ubiquinone] 1 alpha subcomplex subunit 7 n=1 Tax=Aquatica leii TaxID=1421715 RepID=A0AAN7SHA2_9COLE|nr:hypothetical protein RN001_008495 [Aquatica leii]
MGKVKIRDVSPMLQKLRNFLAGRDMLLAVRFPHEVATRSPNLPNLPTGPYDCIHANYYYPRDARREVQPPPVIAPQNQLPAGSSNKATVKSKLPTPGEIHLWDSQYKC